MSNKELEEQIREKDPQDIKKRKERKKAKKDIISTKPETTQKGKKRTTNAEQSLKLFQQRQARIVKQLPRTKGEKNLLRASTKQLVKIAKSLNIEGLSNLRKNDLVILILSKWNNCPKI